MASALSTSLTIFLVLACLSQFSQCYVTVPRRIHTSTSASPFHSYSRPSSNTNLNSKAKVATAAVIERKATPIGIMKLVALVASKFSPTVVGGMLSGGLHAITGPDHLAALLPASIGLSGLNGLRIGAVWGLGHGCSAMVLGMGMYSLKGAAIGARVDVIKKISLMAEYIVGVSLVFIGLLGIKENRAMAEEAKREKERIKEKGQDDDAAVDISDNIVYKNGNAKSSAAIFANGVLHGCSLDGAPSILPAIAMNSVGAAFTFLSSYCIGTIVTMSLTAGTLAELSLRLGKAVNNEDLPRQLSVASSGLAILIGIFWITKSYLGF